MYSHDAITLTDILNAEQRARSTSNPRDALRWAALEMERAMQQHVIRQIQKGA